MTPDPTPTLDYGRPAAPPRRFRSRAAFAVVAACLWGPFGWVALPPWNHTRLLWAALWPVLPGGFAGLAGVRVNPWLALAAAGGLTAVAAAGLTWLGRRGLPHLVAAGLLALLLSVPTSAAAYAAFRW